VARPIPGQFASPGTAPHHADATTSAAARPATSGSGGLFDR
jgi:hypothetical protein